MAVQTPFATVADVSRRLGRTLTADEAARVTVLLRDASAAVVNYTGQQFHAGTTTVTLRPKWGRVRLAQRPVTEVTTVVNGDGDDIDFDWDGADLVDVYGTSAPVTVTYDHGYGPNDIPADIVAVVCQIVGRAFGRSAEGTGLTSETIGSYSYSVGAAAAAGPFGLLNDERAILDRYRRTVGVAGARTWRSEIPSWRSTIF